MKYETLIRDNCAFAESVQNLVALEQQELMRQNVDRNDRFSTRAFTPSSLLKPKDPKGK